MSSFNKVIMMGNLTRDPELSYTPNQTAVVEFGLGSNRSWTAQDGSKRDEACFISCKAWGRTAENIAKFFHKGKCILIEGHLTYESWLGADGTKRSRNRIVIENFRFVNDSRKAEPTKEEANS